MKKLILFTVIFLFGGATYSILHPLLLSFIEKDTSSIVETAQKSPEPEPMMTEVTKVAPQTVPESKVIVDEQGALHDGPFALFDANGNKVQGTVEVIRAPEETLLQFTNTKLTHSNDAVLYLASDKKATSFFNLGSAQITKGVLLYGMPLDIDLSLYNYLLIFDTATEQPQFYAEL